MVRCGDDLLALYQLACALFLPGFQRKLLGPGFTELLADGLPFGCASGSGQRPGSARRSRLLIPAMSPSHSEIMSLAVPT
jgi:asparagine synthase (glutamine-hydrolysing)